VFGSQWKQGSNASFAELGRSGAVVTDKFAAEHHLKLGGPLTVHSSKGTPLHLRIVGVSKPDRFNALDLGEVTIARRSFDSAFAAKRERFAFVQADGGAVAGVKRALAPYPDAKAVTGKQFAVHQSSWVDQILAIFYVLLALCVLVSLFGIVNTLALSVLERTRELGMLKAIGMTRRQVRRMVRHESVITALIGSVLGILVGMFLAALSTTALSDQGMRFAVPVGALVAFTVVAIVAGMLAAILPARRAARLNVLEALQYE